MSATVAIVDDHALFREGLRAVLASHPDLEVVAEASDALSAREAIRSREPDVIVMDIMLPGVSGVALTRELLAENANRRVLALSMLQDEVQVAEALQAGARGYASKHQAAQEVVEAIRLVARGESYLAPSVSRAVVEDYRRMRSGRNHDSPLSSLTARERDVFELTVEGRPVADIAAQLNISPRTVETHRSRILRKLNAATAVDLVRYAARWGLLRDPNGMRG